MTDTGHCSEGLTALLILNRCHCCDMRQNGIMRNTPPVGPAIILRMAIDCQAEKSLYQSRSHRGTPPGNCNCVSVLRREASTANCSVEPRQIQTPSFRPADPTLPTDRQHQSRRSILQHWVFPRPLETASSTNRKLFRTAAIPAL
ncbi:hypothetical protein BT67DRAFT_65671 [Trichocladium antarcticum]|uniref:Uncharacterized protein n=1 Tax=Trichocladium antarcticum TaxID=1450529 RepID=A0AAN6UH65_9PEZI|nr:hypothetical protein BT67DRAFT_65671 [Trichocladium antarcticum]